MSDALLDLDRVDLCVHKWVETSCMDLQSMKGWSVPRCKKCDWMPVGSGIGARGVRLDSLPKIGRGRFPTPPKE